MSWKHYRLVFRLKSPLHIGYRKIGNLMQTRRYVPGKVIWGALTARLTRMSGQGSDAEAYKEVGESLIQHFRFGYLWPAYEGKEGDIPIEPVYPWDLEERRGKNHFDYLFLHSYAGTALDPAGAGAEEGALHHTEFIAPVARNGKPVYLVGDLWVKEPISDGRIEGWKDALDRLQLGGERSYGWGRVNCAKLEETPGGALSGTKVELTEDDVILKLEKSAFLTAHALAADWQFENGNNGKRLFKAMSNGKISGPIEPLTGYEFRGEWRLSFPPICYAPGCRVSDGVYVKIGIYGILASVE